MRILKLIFYACMLFSTTHGSQKRSNRNPDIDNMIYSFHRLIWQGNENAVFDILENPQQFSARFHLNYTAEQLCKTSDRWGRTCLHQAALTLEDTTIITEAFIACGANVNAPDQDGNRPLHFLANPATVRVLLNHGADINAKNKHRKTAINTYGTIYKEIPTLTENLLKLRLSNYNTVERCIIKGYDCDPTFYERAQKSKKFIKDHAVITQKK